MLDNVGHDEPDRPRGSSAKLDAFPQAFKVHKTAPFSQIEQGAVEVTCHRSRLGDAGRAWTMPIGNGRYEPPHERSESPSAQRARRAREGKEAFRRACVKALEEHSPLGRDALLKAAREAGAKGKSETMRNWLAKSWGDPASGLMSDPHRGYLLADSPGPASRGQGGATPPGRTLAPQPHHSRREWG